nr:hypothetical protein [Tanacetum cinerariifolium]
MKSTTTTTAPNIGYVLITVYESPTIDNSAPISFGPTSYAKLVTGEPSRKSVNFCTLFAPGGNRADVAIPIVTIRAISERFANTTYGLFLGNGWLTSLLLTMSKTVGVNMDWGRSSYARAMIELRADDELKDTIVVAILKLVGEGFNMCTIRVGYEWKPLRCSSCKVFGYVLNECLMKIVTDVVNNLNNPKQATRGVAIGPKVTKQFYRRVSNKNSASTSGKKKQAEVSRQDVSNSNPFDALTSIKNDDDLGTNGGNSKLAGKGSLNVAHGSSSNTLIADKIDKLERQILDGKLMFVDDDGNSLVPTCNVDNDNEVEVVFDETINLMASTSFKGGSERCYGNILWSLEAGVLFDNKFSIWKLFFRPFDLLDEDVVCVCLLLALEYVFMSNELIHVIADEVLSLVDNLSSQNEFLCGEHM